MFCDTLAVVLLSSYLGAAGDHAALYHGRLELAYEQVTWKDHPFWGESTDFTPGTVCYDGVLYPSVLMRYDIRTNQLSVLSPESKIAIAPDMKQIDYFEMAGQRFVRLPDGWFGSVASEGEAVRLLNSVRKTQSISKIEGKYVYKTLATSNRYFLQYNDSTTIEVSDRKSLRNAVPAYADSLKHMTRRQRLSFSKKKREQSLAACASYLNGIIEREQPLSKPSFRPIAQPCIATPTIPDSIYAGLTLAEALPTYRAYIPGGKASHYFVDEYWDSDQTPGITALEQAREARILDEVEVMAFRRKVEAERGGIEAFSPSDLHNMPMSMGEADVLKMASMMPGIISTGEVSSGLNVRGGGADQNLLLYNASTLFNPMHVFGLTSAFNADMISETEIYKGTVSSQYGGRLSSVIRLKGRYADKEDLHGSASIGLLSAKMWVGLPLKKGKSSLLLGGRSSYSDWMLGLLPEKSDYKNGKAGFMDYNANFTTTIDDHRRLNIYGYYSRDRFSFTTTDRYVYSNLNLAAEYHTRRSEDWGSVLSAGLDRYTYANDDRAVNYEAGRLSFALNQYFLRWHISHPVGEKHTQAYGAQAQFYDIMPGQYEPLGSESFIQKRRLDLHRGLDLALYAEERWQLSDALTLTGGLRLESFTSLRSGKEKTYINPGLSLSDSYRLTPNSAVNAGFNTMYQNIHKVSNTVIMSPTDVWILSNARIKPQTGYQVTAGYTAQTPDGIFEFSAEIYLKRMRNYLAYRSGAQLIMNNELEDDVIPTLGRAYGIELQLRRLTGRLTGWISYTYARVEQRQQYGRETSPISAGQWFPADYDCPHQLKAAGNYRITRRYSFSLNTDCHTGRPYTAPIGSFYDERLERSLPIYSKRNEVRLPDYVRVDGSFNIEPSHHLIRLTKHWISIGVYNLFGRRNAYSIYYVSEAEGVKGYQLSIFGAPIPYVSYNIKF